MEWLPECVFSDNIYKTLSDWQNEDGIDTIIQHTFLDDFLSTNLVKEKGLSAFFLAPIATQYALTFAPTAGQPAHLNGYS